jgi:hypothetical protein
LVTVNPQDADAINDGAPYYTGPLNAFTANVTSSTATFTMSAFVKNKKGENFTCGDIATARVTFWYKISGSSSWVRVPNGSNLPVSYVDPNDPAKGGTAAVIAQLNIGSAANEIYDIKVEIGGNYKSRSECSVNTIMVYKPSDAGTIKGCINLNAGGSTQTGVSTGFVKGDQNFKTNVGFTVGFTMKSGKPQNPKGKVTLYVKSYAKRDGSIDNVIHTYKIQSNAIASLVFPTSNTAQFTGKANIAEVISDGATEVLDPIEGNCTMVFDLTDVTCSGTGDLAGIVVYRNSGGIWYSNNYTTKGVTERAAIASGNVDVTNSACRTAPSSAIANGTMGTSMQLDEFNARPTPAATELNAKIFPNPSTNVFNLTFSGGTKEKLDVTVMDVSGRTVKSYKVDPIGTFRFGDSLRPGIYMIQVKQGQSNRIFKVIKQ